MNQAARQILARVVDAVGYAKTHLTRITDPRRKLGKCGGGVGQVPPPAARGLAAPARQ